MADIVELSTDHEAKTVSLDLLKAFINELVMDKYNIQFLRSQIYLLLLRRYLHFHPIDRANKQYMEKARVFLGNLDSLVSGFEVK